MHHGDVLLTTPIFSALKRHFPGVQVDVLVYAETVPMIAANPNVDNIWPMLRSHEAGKGIKRLKGIWQLLKQLRGRRYDWVLHLNDQWAGALVALVSGAPLRASYAMEKRSNALWRHAFQLQLPVVLTGHVVERNLAFLRDLGLPIDMRDSKCLMAFDEDARALAQGQLAKADVGNDYILVQPTSRWFFKCWEDNHFAEVLLALANDGHRIVLTAGPDPRELGLINSLLELAPHPRIVSLAGRFTLPALAAAIAGAKLFIGVDSVPMHMAAALGVPSVALFGPTNVEAWRPWSEKAILIHAADYGPLIGPNEVDTTTNQRYLSNIPVLPVLEAARQQLSRYDRTGN